MYEDGAVPDELDPEVQAWLASFPPPDPDAPPKSLEEMRAQPWPWGTRPPVHEVWDASAIHAGLEVPVRVYRPSEHRPLAVTVFLHGGGFVLGSIDIVDPQCRQLANQVGCVVVNVGYRLAPEDPYPAALDDCVAVVHWVVEHAPALGIDPGRIAIVGESAGGNLAAATALRLRDEGGPALAQQVLLYPVLDHDFERPSMADNDPLLSVDGLRWFWDQYAPPGVDRTHRYLSPTRADLEDLAGVAPATVVTAGRDPLCDEGDEYATRLAEAGVEVVHLRYPTMIHGFVAMAESFTLGAEARDAVAGVLTSALGGTT